MTLDYDLLPSVGSPEYQKAPDCSMVHQIVVGCIADSGGMDCMGLRKVEMTPNCEWGACTI